MAISKARSSSSSPLTTLICCLLLVTTFNFLPESSADLQVPILPYSSKLSLRLTTCAVAWIVAAQEARGQKGAVMGNPPRRDSTKSGENNKNT
ncbi:hypothetical protein NL676_006888 [Syzygium grande]|nr:hypothetical protein NL676_006888 [Syzygium grande]